MPSSEAALSGRTAAPFEPVRLGVIGAGWIARVHVDAARATRELDAVAIADYPRARGGRPGRGAALARELGLERHHPDYRAMLDDPRVEAVTVALPNALHAEVTLAALDAGKHVLVEKPLCLTLAEADRILALAAERRLVVGYAEELPYCPKFVRGKALVDAGAIGRLFHVEQVEAHGGPYSDWFFDAALAGGGALMDMGCHALEYARYMFDKAPVARVTAHMATHLHRGRGGARGDVEDHAIVHLELADGRTALLEAGWALQGGMDSSARLQGAAGVLDVDLLRHSGLELYSAAGVPREDIAPGWSAPSYDWLLQNGYPQELQDFARAVRTGAEPRESARDGRAVLELIWAAYASAAEGRSVALPYAPPPGVDVPVAPWIDRARRG